MMRSALSRWIMQQTDGGDLIGGETKDLRLIGGCIGNIAISAPPLIRIADRRCRTHRKTLFNKTIALQLLEFAKEMHPLTAPIAISALDLSAWSWRLGTDRKSVV